MTPMGISKRINPLLIMMALLPILVSCRPDMTACKESSEEWMQVQCEKEPGGSACPEHALYNENLLVLIYNCQSDT